MSRLTRVAYTSRRVIKFSVIGFFAIIFLRMGVKALKSYWLARHPPPPPAPTVAFGKLPPVSFSEEKKKPEAEFALQTIEGDLPQMPDQAKVFFVIPQENRFLALEKTDRLAKNLGFSPPGEELRSDLYRYQNSNLKTSLTINPLTKTFRYRYPYLEDQTLIGLPMPSEEELINQARGFLAKIGRDHDDLSPQEAKVSLWRIKEKKLDPAASLSEANIAQVDFFRDKIEGQYPVYPQNMDRANVSLLLSADTRGQRQVVETDYTYLMIDREKYATYPIKTAAQAWEELGQGQYHLAGLASSPASGSIAIRRVYLAYLDPHYPTNFLQPIYVFEGDSGFYGFVPAISIEWLAE